jgi:hypothetical protein
MDFRAVRSQLPEASAEWTAFVARRAATAAAKLVVLTGLAAATDSAEVMPGSAAAPAGSAADSAGKSARRPIGRSNNPLFATGDSAGVAGMKGGPKGLPAVSLLDEKHL